MPDGGQFNLVLLPGLDGTGILFAPLLRALPPEVRPTVIVYPPDRQLSLEEHARFVAERLPAGKAVLLAESFSGLVALRLLSGSVASIQQVLFVAAFAEGPYPLLLRVAASLPGAGSAVRRTPAPLLRAMCLGGEGGQQVVDLAKKALASVSSRVLSHRLRLVAQAAPPKANFEVPCHYLRGREDRLISPGAAEWFRRHFETCDVESVAGPHMLMQVRPVEGAAWVMRKLTEHAAAKVRPRQS